MNETAPTRVWYRPMRARDDGEPHRVSTTLELLFDLCFVVAVGQAAIAMHHSLVENHLFPDLFAFLFVFWGIWWPWFQFSWFATSYDTDDVPYRLAVLLQIGGGLVIAAGVSRAFEGHFGMFVAGYVLMRLAAVSQWLRAARSDPERRPTALRYAAGITSMQVYWVMRLLVPDSFLVPTLVLGLLGELLVPMWAERAAGTTWHPHHIAERYGLFTIIVLGETVIGATTAIKEGVDEGKHLVALAGLGAGGLVIVFAMWWLYFDRPGARRLTSLNKALVWGYGHYVIFVSAAAVGVGMEVAVDQVLGRSHLAPAAGAFALTLPVALFLLSVWCLQVGPRDECRPIAIGYPLAALLILAGSFTPVPVGATAMLIGALVAFVVVVGHGEREPAPADG